MAVTIAGLSASVAMQVIAKVPSDFDVIVGVAKPAMGAMRRYTLYVGRLSIESAMALTAAVYLCQQLTEQRGSGATSG